MKTSLLNDVQIYCLHHPSLTYRKKQLTEDFKKISTQKPVIWLEDFPPEIASIFEEPFSITTRELSLSLKHRQALKMISENSADISLLFEDDINIESVPDINIFLEKCLEEFVETKGDLCWVGGTRELVPSSFISNQVIYYQYLDRCTHGFFVHKKCVDLLLENYHFHRPADHLYKELIPLCNLKSAWTYPFLSQKTIDGTWNSSIRNYN